MLSFMVSFNVNSNDATDSTEARTQENNENPVIKKDEAKKVSPSLRG